MHFHSNNADGIVCLVTKRWMLSCDWPHTGSVKSLLTTLSQTVSSHTFNYMSFHQIVAICPSIWLLGCVSSAWYQRKSSLILKKCKSHMSSISLRSSMRQRSNPVDKQNIIVRYDVRFWKGYINSMEENITNTNSRIIQHYYFSIFQTIVIYTFGQPSS